MDMFVMNWLVLTAIAHCLSRHGVRFASLTNAVEKFLSCETRLTVGVSLLIQDVCHDPSLLVPAMPVQANPVTFACHLCCPVHSSISFRRKPSGSPN